MKLSLPIHILKTKAKDISCSHSIPLHKALDQVAQTEGFASWSLLKSKIEKFVPQNAQQVLQYIYPGDLLLLAARPGLGKTRLVLELLLKAVRQKNHCFFFSFEYAYEELIRSLKSIDKEYDESNPYLTLDLSDEISANYIIDTTKDYLPEGGIIAVDYLQLLDQQRHKPPIETQIESLKSYAREKKYTLIFTSQIDRCFDQKGNVPPCLENVRLPNPLDMKLFNKVLFIHNMQIYKG